MSIFLCRICCNRLELTYEFKRKCLGNFNRFQSYVRKLKYINLHCETKYVFNEIKVIVSDLRSHKMKLKPESNEETKIEGCEISLNNKENTNKIASIEGSESRELSNKVDFQVKMLDLDKNTRVSEETPQVIMDQRKNSQFTEDFEDNRTLTKLSEPCFKNKLQFKIKNKTSLDETSEVMLGKFENEIKIESKPPENSIVENSIVENSLVEVASIVKVEGPNYVNDPNGKLLHKWHDLKNEHDYKLKTEPDTIERSSEQSKNQQSIVSVEDTSFSHKVWPCLPDNSYEEISKNRTAIETNKIGNASENVIENNRSQRENFEVAIANENRIISQERRNVGSNEDSEYNSLDPNMCLTCGKSFSTKTNLNKHFVIHKRPLFECPKCGEYFIRNILLQSHILLHESRQAYECILCDKTFYSTVRLKCHIYKFHPYCTSFKGKFYSCFTCKKQYFSAQDLKSHIAIHLDKEKFLCMTCGRGFETRPNLKRHLYVHSDEEKPVFVCSICGKRFTMNSSLKLHLTIHENKRPHGCKICGKTFLKKTGLNCHILKHRTKLSDNKLPAEAQREESSNSCSETAIEEHFIKMEHDSQDFKLETEEHYDTTINKPFNINQFFKRIKSLETNSAEPLYTCVICGKVSSHKGNLKRHINTHNKESRLRYNCSICKKQCTSKSGLDKHVLNKHYNKRPFACTMCDKSFFRKYLLQEHVFEVHNESSSTI